MVDAKEFSATKVWIGRILNGKYVKEVEEEKQNHVLLNDGRKIYRANLIATIVGIDIEDRSIFVDDGTGRIKVKSFDEKFPKENFSLGDVVLVIGKIREFGEKYILLEIIKKITDKRWIEVRKKELGEVKKEEKESEEKKEDFEQKENIVEDIKENRTDTILSVIRNLDEGDGADLDQVLLALSTTATEKDIEEFEKTSRKSNSSKITQNKNDNIKEYFESFIEKLLNEGEIFQTKPGKIKVLD
ncbi:MAG: hypothetical protein AABX39_02415 [Nanoarchaeota archaeon]